MSVESTLSIVRQIMRGWRSANARTIEWPVCRASQGRGERGQQEVRCRYCGGNGRTAPSLGRRLTMTWTAFWSMN
jgi:hypothetical protein